MRARIPERVLDQEREWITQFCLRHLVADDTSIVAVQQVFEAYEEYLNDRGCGCSRLSVVGFGGMLPNVYTRRVVRVNGVALRRLVGVKIA